MKADFLLVGSGWRAEFFLRAAQMLPERFGVTGVVTSSRENAARYASWGFRCHPDLESALGGPPADFAVVSVAAHAAPGVSLRLLRHGLPVLMETPAAASMDDLLAFYAALPQGAKLEVAEQYHLRPDHQARLALIQKGRIGRPVQAHISLTNSYHGVSLIRKYLGVSGIRAVVRGQRFAVPGMPGHGRGGPPEAEMPQEYPQTLATFDFGGALGILNFEEMQHRSYIRSQIIQIKGDRGELMNDRLRYLMDYRTPMYATLQRHNRGEEENMEGAGLKGITSDGAWVYTSPYPQTRFTDDEIAVTACLEAMAGFCAGGPSCYSLAQAAQDCYLCFLMEQAIAGGTPVEAGEQPWTPELRAGGEHP